MANIRMGTYLILLALICVAPWPASAQSFRVQCPTSTITHPSTLQDNNSEPAYTGPTTFTTGANGFLTPLANVNGAIKCQQISGGDGYATMGDGTQTYMFCFGPLSGLADIAAGQPGTEPPNVFNMLTPDALVPGDPATTVDNAGSFNYNGAVGLAPDLDCIAENAAALAANPPEPLPCPNLQPGGIDGHVDPRHILDVGVMNGNIPAPLMAIDEDDEFFLTLSNVGMIMRPELFEQHTVHFHGYPNASAFFDGVPAASVAINIGGSFTYYYLAPDAGTYFWHCHITPPEHLQMGMVGQLFVRPRQNRVAVGGNLYAARVQQDLDQRTACVSANDILCSNPLPAGGAGANTATRAGTGSTPSGNYAYNDVEYPLQIHGFDPNFHFVGMTFNPEAFADMKDKYFLLNGRSYPDTTTPGPLQTRSADSVNHFSQPLPAIINIPAGKKALLRISDLDVSEYQTLASLGIPMTVIGYNAKLLRDQARTTTYYNTSSLTLGGGESLDVILDATDTASSPVGCCFHLYTPTPDHLSMA